MTTKSLCIHWWVIGEYSVGQCKKCGASRDFEKLRQAEQNRKVFQRGKIRAAASPILP